MANSELILGTRGGLHKYVVAETTATTSQLFSQMLTALATNGGDKLYDAIQNYGDTLILKNGAGHIMRLTATTTTQGTFSAVTGNTSSGSSIISVRFDYTNGSISGASYVIAKISNSGVSGFENKNGDTITSSYAGTWQIYYLD